MAKKLNIEFIRAEFKKEGYELLTEVYENSKQKLEYICPKGHRHSVSWDNWSNKGTRCPCFSKYSNKPTIEFICAEFTKEGYILITKKYEGCCQKLKYICSRGHHHSVTWSHWNSKGKDKRRCPYCANNAKLTIEFIRSEFKKEGYELLTEVYENSKQKLEYICPMGHHHSITWGHWNSKEKRRCPFCNGNAKLTIEFIRSEFAKEGYILLSTEYKNAHSKLYVECPEGHRYYVLWNSWQQGQRCPKRSNNVSEWERTVKKFLIESNINHVSNDKSQLINPNTGCSLELDIWFPDKMKAIECNGLYWHSKPGRKNCDKIKQQLCKDQSIDLLTVTDKEWNDNTDECKEKLISFVEAGGLIWKL